MSGFGAAPVTGGNARVNVFDGTRQLYTDSEDLLITVEDGNKKIVSREDYDSASVKFTELKVFGNAGDNYTFLASAKGYKDAGFFPVKIAENTLQVVDLMLLPQSNGFNFAGASWDSLGGARPVLKAILAAGTKDDAAAGDRYNDLKDIKNGAVLACLLNITTAMGQILLPQKTALDYLKMIRWDMVGQYAMAQDRFFGWADPAIIPQIEQAKLQGKFDDASYALHPGATRSYKQKEFGEANVQLTFHEKDQLEIDGLNCVMIEPDIDYYRDPLAHLILEVAVNAFGSLTDPRAVYQLRWIAGRRAGVPEFDPLYTIVRA